MSLVFDTLTGVLSTTGATALAAAGIAVRRRYARHTAANDPGGATAAPAAEAPCLRHYTLLRTNGPDDHPVHYETTRPPGTVITRQVAGRPVRFELTAVALGDGTYAAEPLD